MRIQIKPWVIPTITGVSAFACGFGTALLVLRKKFNHDEEQIRLVFDELMKLKEENESLQVQLDFKLEEHDEKLSSLVQQNARILKEIRTEKPFEEVVIDNHPSNGRIDLMPVANKNDDSLVVNIFKDDSWDYDVEVPLRTPDKPYVIHVDEFFSNEEEYEHCSLMYYAGDNILCDELSVPIYDAERLVGKLEFGKGSQDPNVVYIRNDHNAAEYEVLFDPGYYQTEVLGEAVEKNLKHSHQVPKFRFE